MATWGHNSNVTGTATVIGIDSTWNNSDSLYIGNYGNGILNIGNGIGSGGSVKAKTLALGKNTKSSGICNLNGGILQVSTIGTSPGSAVFNWLDGTIRNYDANTPFNIGLNVPIKLATTGVHAFNIDAGRYGIVSAILADATSGGTLAKLGEGTLSLTSANTYTGSTTHTCGEIILEQYWIACQFAYRRTEWSDIHVSAKSGGFFVGASGKRSQGSGTIVGNLTINGMHVPGNSTGIETVRGNYSMTGETSSILPERLRGQATIEILVTGRHANYNVTLGGTLELHWDDMYGSTNSSKLWILKNDTAGIAFRHVRQLCQRCFFRLFTTTASGFSCMGPTPLRETSPAGTTW